MWRVDYVETDLGQRFTAPSELLQQFTHAMHAFPVHGGYNWAMGAGNASFGKGAPFFGFPIGINGPKTSELGDVVLFSGPEVALGPNFQIVGLSMGLSPWVEQPSGQWLGTQSLDISWDPTPEPGTAALAALAATGLGGLYRHRRRGDRRPSSAPDRSIKSREDSRTGLSSSLGAPPAQGQASD
jgi:hypothetical protein